LNDDIQLIFLELPKFVKQVKRPKSKLEGWMAYFAGMGGAMMEEVANQESMISDALVAERFFMMDSDRRLAYMMDWKHIMEEADLKAREADLKARAADLKAQATDLKAQTTDLKAQLEKEKAEARREKAKGRAEGKAEGTYDASVKIARNFLSEGIPPEIVAKNTGLPLGDVERLAAR